MNCIVCDGFTLDVKNLPEAKILGCKNCGLEFVYPMPSVGELDKFYSNYVDVRADDDVVLKNSETNIRTLSKYGLTKSSHLLDFGCGKNIFCRLGSCTWIGYDKYTMDIRVPNEVLDFVTLWGVLEHLVNPVEEVRRLNELLKIGGKIVITTVGKTGIPYQYKFPEHLTYWSRESIEKLLSTCGFKMLECTDYRMYQKPDVFLDAISKVAKIEPRTRKMLNINMLPGEKYVEIPTNEIFVVGEKI